jgi:hypothetical protein
MKVSLVDLKTSKLSIIMIHVLSVCIEIQVSVYHLATILGNWIWWNFYGFFHETEVLCVGSCFHYFCRILEPNLVVVYTCIVEVVCGTMLGFGF